MYFRIYECQLRSHLKCLIHIDSVVKYLSKLLLEVGDMRDCMHAERARID